MPRDVETHTGPNPLSLFSGVRVTLKAELGATELTIERILSLKTGEVVTLDKAMNEPVDILLNDKVVARGEIVAVDDQFGIRLTELNLPS